MSQPSQELLNQQLEVKKLRKEASTLELTIRHRQSEIRAAQRKLNDLDEQFVRKTSRLAKEQVETVEALVQPLKRELGRLSSEVDAQRVTVAENYKTIGQQQKDIDTLNGAFLEVDQSLKDATTAFGVSEAKNNQLIRENGQLRVTRDSLPAEITDLEVTKAALIKDLEELVEEKKGIESSIAQVQAEHTENLKKKEQRLYQINQEMLRLTQDREALRREENAARDELARREKILNERDKNLRVREAKVEMGEGKILNNANLLNL